ncbi:hypothetical protein ILUMI_18537 [Ignelater luminosus]|uniref:DDE-1 domain-containing protein n=1 Tax=Ignelater luminosus TaxID=2038154 RepID=A0A8K0CPY7_IGNLU|nr:hypothetical protein ILUMI_18537 [Ignelater luminosus]
MPIYYKRIKDREVNPDDMRQAIIDILDNNMSLRNNVQRKPKAGHSTIVTTVQKVQKIVGKEDAHQIGQVTSKERGELVTHVRIICASGSAIPPVWIFPRHRFDQARMMKDIADTGPLGLVYPSGWLTCANFLKVLEHFVKHVSCSQENKVLLIMDNHESHLSIDAVDFFIDCCLPGTETGTSSADVGEHLSSGKANNHPSSSSSKPPDNNITTTPRSGKTEKKAFVIPKHRQEKKKTKEEEKGGVA